MGKNLVGIIQVEGGGLGRQLVQYKVVGGAGDRCSGDLHSKDLFESLMASDSEESRAAVRIYEVVDLVVDSRG